MNISFLIFTIVLPVVSWGQGKSLIQNEKKEESAEKKQGWGGSVGFSSEKTLDEFQKPYWGTGLGISYTVREETTFGASLDFKGPYAQADADPRLVQGIGDVGVEWAEKLGTSYRLGDLSSKVGVQFPTSEVSRRQTKRIGSSYGLSLSTPLKGFFHRFKIVTSLGADVNVYKYDFATVFGEEFNSPLGFSQGLGLAWEIIKDLNWINTYSTAQRYDYGERWTPGQTYTSALAYKTPVGASISATYKWADQVFTNDPTFTPRKSSLTGEVSYEF